MILSDGLGCFAGVLDADCEHLPIVVCGRKPRDEPEFAWAWVNTVLGNLMTTLAGAHHAFKYRRQLDPSRADSLPLLP